MKSGSGDGVPGGRAGQKRGGGLRDLVGQDLGAGQAEVIVEGRVQVAMASRGLWWRVRLAGCEPGGCDCPGTLPIKQQLHRQTSPRSHHAERIAAAPRVAYLSYKEVVEMPATAIQTCAQSGEFSTRKESARL